uniref:Uncharacterized protein n=1 Tax=Anguilla anguilla TaxID=7936 RepID=A0A0E9VL64_ANGAN
MFFFPPCEAQCCFKCIVCGLLRGS